MTPRPGSIRSVASDPALLAGWEPSAPVGDTLLRRFLHNWTESAAAPVEAAAGRVLRRDDLVATDRGGPAGFFNAVLLQRPLAVEDTVEVATALDEVYAAGTGEVWLFSAWPTPDLSAFGWVLEGHPPLMMRPPGPPAPPPEPARLAVEGVTEAGALREFERVCVDGYPLPELAGAPAFSLLHPSALSDPRLRLWLGRLDGRAVGAAMAFVDAGVVDVTLVATLPEARGRGVGTAMTWRATLADPALPAVLLASDDGRPVYERMGYVPLLRFTAWRRSRP